jgi:uncharacterized protein YeaO (DUF488 family)
MAVVSLERQIAVVRIHDPDQPVLGARVLVDGLWPRGVRRDDLRLHSWERPVAPSRELRRWYAHDPEQWDEFRERYRAELDDEDRRAALGRLSATADELGLTILTATRAVEISHAMVIADVLRARSEGESV